MFQNVLQSPILGKGGRLTSGNLTTTRVKDLKCSELKKTKILCFEKDHAVFFTIHTQHIPNIQMHCVKKKNIKMQT